MKITRYFPTDKLKPFIKAFILLESAEEKDNHILPDTSMVMAFRYRGMVSSISRGHEEKLPSFVITGIRKHSRIMHYGSETSNLLVLFREGGAAPFLKIQLHELFETSSSLDNFFLPGKLHEVEDLLSSSKSNLNRIAIIERLLLSCLKEKQHGLPVVKQAIQEIGSANGHVKIKNLANSLYISQDALEKNFRQITGTTPKQFARIVRLRTLIDHYKSGESLTELAYHAGYFDQAHLIKDFESFTGQAPRDFFSKTPYW